MKPLHVGLLLAGAGLAAGIAFKLAQPPPLPVPATAIQPPIAPPAAADVPARKPSPIEIPRTNVPTTLRAAAPETVYDQPPKAASRTNEANLTANPKPIRPKQWVPGRYESGSGTVTATGVDRTKGAAAPVVTASINRSAAVAVQPAIQKEPAPASPPPAQAHQATLRTGMAIVIRLDQSLSSDSSRSGGTFAGVLAEPLIADGFVIAETGARVTGRVVESEKAGRFTGASRLSLGLMNVSTSDGQTVSVTTDPWMKLGDNVAAGTVIPFRLTSKVTITEQQVAAR